MSLQKKAFAEFLGTFWLVFGGCGSAVLAVAFPGLGIGFVGVAFAFGLTLLTMAYAIEHISGGFAPIAIGLGLTLIHLISIPVTNTSVNPARSTAPALFVGGWALQQLWLFWVAPIVGAAVAGVVYSAVFAERELPGVSGAVVATENA
jgi:aquaporin Z